VNAARVQDLNAALCLVLIAASPCGRSGAGEEERETDPFADQGHACALRLLCSEIKTCQIAIWRGR